MKQEEQAAGTGTRVPRILLRSSWQVVNIGDIAHTPGVLALLEQQLPEAEVRLWASPDLTDEVIEMEHRRFPELKIVKGTIGPDGQATSRELAEAVEWCDFLLHGSGPYLVANEDVQAFVQATGKPFGVFGITYSGNPAEKDMLDQAEFVYFRDTVSLEKARECGVVSPVMEFGPDGAFSADLRNDAKAERYLQEAGLQAGEFLCCIPKLRLTPYWTIKPEVAFDAARHERNERMKEHDHVLLREAVAAVVRQTGKRILLCPEDSTQMAVGKEMIFDKLPEDVRSHVVWRESFWLTDEALSVYVRSAGLFGNEMHSPIMCVGNGIPAIVCRWEEQTSKGYMWRDIGLGDWLFDQDNEADRSRLVAAVLEMAQDTEAAKRKAEAARDYVRASQLRMIATLRRSLGRCMERAGL
ncbi:Polysaccharide pyruvyl transferase [Paenibacillus sp. UNCCL117]|uniref:polysaccharide pyruvyl transferase family protein n=1 Tax=unclassified Paenibacillus TaxID=185978 RepID=UPI0008818D89|nr:MULTISPECIES: polysaccharide pyruvyl transferase family protein [unclassified Paenibacillus]SDC13181.1 Polysaccharide pyruvyl transferase [Paenibacillus sp. cl123]SFW16984.1 Polysaccharide pyruvyl transferase [Paenibacillus sp. UNCCL117]